MCVIKTDSNKIETLMNRLWSRPQGSFLILKFLWVRFLDHKHHNVTDPNYTSNKWFQRQQWQL